MPTPRLVRRGFAAALGALVLVIPLAATVAQGADDSFSGPGYPIGCEPVYTIGSSTYRNSLPPQMIASTMGLPVPVAGTPAQQTLVIGEINGVPYEAEIDNLLADCGLEPQNWTTITDSSTPPVSNANAGEATLDLTVVAGILPANVTLTVVNTGEGFNNMLLLGAQACGLDPNADPATWRRSQLTTPVGGCVISNSYGSTEQELAAFGAAYVEGIDEIMAGLAQAGVIVLFSVGDEGSGGCTPDSIGRVGQLAPQWPASHPDALAVGGTMWVEPTWNESLFDPQLVNYVPGTTYTNAAWSDEDGGTDCSNTTKSGTGGGISSTYSLPGYQADVASVAPAGQRNSRLIPDVAALAGWPGWVVEMPGSVSMLRGTSAATPLVAVGLLHVNAQLTAAGYAPIDNAGGAMDVHTIFYSPDFRGALSDVTMGSNALFTGIGGWDAQAGFDLTTGWGVPDFTRLAQLLMARASARGGQAPPPVIQQVALTPGGTCADIAVDLNWAGVASGGWGTSWAQWPNGGTGGPVCSRMLVYSLSLGRWTLG